MTIAADTGHLNGLDWKISIFQITLFAVLINAFLQLLHDYGTDQVTVQRLISTGNHRSIIRVIFTNSATINISLAYTFSLLAAWAMHLPLGKLEHTIWGLRKSRVTDPTDTVLPEIPSK